MVPEGPLRPLGPDWRQHSRTHRDWSRSRGCSHDLGEMMVPEAAPPSSEVTREVNSRCNVEVELTGNACALGVWYVSKRGA